MEKEEEMFNPFVKALLILVLDFWLRVGLGCAGRTIGAFRGLFQLKQFYNSVISQFHDSMVYDSMLP